MEITTYTIQRASLQNRRLLFGHLGNSKLECFDLTSFQHNFNQKRGSCLSWKNFEIIIFIESFPQTCFEGKWLQNRLRADKNESRSLLAVDIQGHQREGFCIVPFAGGDSCCIHAAKFTPVLIQTYASIL